MDEEEAKKILSDGLTVVSVGTNDFLFNFYGIPRSSLEYNINGYQAFVQIGYKVLSRYRN